MSDWTDLLAAERDDEDLEVLRHGQPQRPFDGYEPRPVARSAEAVA